MSSTAKLLGVIIGSALAFSAAYGNVWTGTLTVKDIAFEISRESETTER